MILFVDFDYTLFNSAAMQKSLHASYEKQGIVRAVIEDTYKQARMEHAIWFPDNHTQKIAAVSRVSERKLNDLSKASIHRAHMYVYPDVLPWLTRMRRRHILIMVSYGHDAHQRSVIKRCGVGEYMSHIIITRNKLKDDVIKRLSSHGKESLFIDDNPDALSAVKKVAPHVTTVRMERGEGTYSNKKTGPGVDYSVNSLQALDTIVAL